MCIRDSRKVIEALIPYARADLVARAHAGGEVLKREDRDDGTWIVANVSPKVGAELVPFATHDPWAKDDDD